MLDAVRIEDDSQVMLKQVKRSWYPEEVNLHQYLLSEPLGSDPRNHTIPLLDILHVPDDEDTDILVMPLLCACDSPAWKTVGEVVAFIAQIFEASATLYCELVHEFI